MYIRQGKSLHKDNYKIWVVKKDKRHGQTCKWQSYTGLEKKLVDLYVSEPVQMHLLTTATASYKLQFAQQKQIRTTRTLLY